MRKKRRKKKRQWDTLRGTTFIAVEGRKSLTVCRLCPNIFLVKMGCKQSSIKLIFM
jgi:hypothetical protein